MAGPALNSTASRFLLYFTGTGATDVLHERRAQNAAVFLDREICLVPMILRFWRAHTIESQTSTRLRVRGLGPSGRARAKYFRCELRA